MYVKSIALESIRGFQHLEFDFERSNGVFAGWTVILGGNASGKSTILKSIAMGLIGPDASRELLGSASSWSGWLHANEKRADINTVVRWDTGVDRFRTGGASPGAAFTTGVRFVFEGRGLDFGDSENKPNLIPTYERTSKGRRILSPVRGPWNPNARGWFSAGYGPMRRLTGSSSESVRFSMGSGSVSRFFTLFREDAALTESETWLKTAYSRWLEDKSPHQKMLTDKVSDLLSDNLLPHGMKVSRITVDHVYVEDGRGLELPMRDISDGCRGVYATVLDLIHGMYSVYGIDGLFDTTEDGHPFVTKPGVVLIDEIEAHLHPSWQREVPEWFKTHFPKVQFLVTTHSPLVAQAADPNGIFLLPSFGDIPAEPRALTEEEIERLRLGRAEKTLLGIAFGLKTVRSKYANERIEDWKHINAKAKSGIGLSRAEVVEKNALESQMKIAFEEA